MKYLKSYKIFELHSDTIKSAWVKAVDSGDMDKAKMFLKKYYDENDHHPLAYGTTQPSFPERDMEVSNRLLKDIKDGLMYDIDSVEDLDIEFMGPDKHLDHFIVSNPDESFMAFYGDKESVKKCMRDNAIDKYTNDWIYNDFDIVAEMLDKDKLKKYCDDNGLDYNEDNLEELIRYMETELTADYIANNFMDVKPIAISEADSMLKNSDIQSIAEYIGFEYGDIYELSNGEKIYIFQEQ
jgi:hypothetical protein